MTGRESLEVLLSCYACAPGTGTEPGFGWFTSQQLSVQGHTVHVMTRSGNRPAIEAHHAAHPTAESRTFHYVALPGPFRWLREGTGPHYLLWQLSALLYARELSRRTRLDVIHHVTYGSLQGGSLLWALNRPFVFGPAGGAQVAPPQARRYFGDAWRSERIRAAVTGLMRLSPLHHLLARRSARMYATNTQTAVAMARLGAPGPQLFLDSGLPDGLLATDVPSRQADGTLRILWVGRLLRRKAVRLALESVAALGVPFHLTIVGRGPDSSLVPEWIEELGLTGKVSAPGFLPWMDVMQLYREQDVFLFTSLRDSFGSQLLEAAAQGLPVVCLDHQGAGDFLPDAAAIKVPLGQADRLAGDLAAALARFAAQSCEQRQQMGRAGLTFARSHTWERKVSGYVAAYREVTAR